MTTDRNGSQILRISFKSSKMISVSCCVWLFLSPSICCPFFDWVAFQVPRNPIKKISLFPNLGYYLYWCHFIRLIRLVIQQKLQVHSIHIPYRIAFSHSKSFEIKQTHYFVDVMTLLNMIIIIFLQYRTLKSLAWMLWIHLSVKCKQKWRETKIWCVCQKLLSNIIANEIMLNYAFFSTRTMALWFFSS